MVGFEEEPDEVEVGVEVVEVIEELLLFEELDVEHL